MTSAVTAITRSAWVPTIQPDPQRRRESGYGHIPLFLYTSSTLSPLCNLPQLHHCLTKLSHYAHTFFYWPLLLFAHFSSFSWLCYLHSWDPLTGSVYENILLLSQCHFHTIYSLNNCSQAFCHVVTTVLSFQVCTKCVRCKSCGATKPGKSWDAQWSHDFSMCHDCAKLFAKGEWQQLGKCCSVLRNEYEYTMHWYSFWWQRRRIS